MCRWPLPEVSPKREALQPSSCRLPGEEKVGVFQGLPELGWAGVHQGCREHRPPK